jgi:hypothetical protein
MYQRSRALLERLEPHIFHGSAMRLADLRAGLRSLWRQGFAQAPRREYFRLLWTALRRDFTRFREATRATADLERRLRSLSVSGQVRLGDRDIAPLSALVDRAREALVRAQPERQLEEVAAWAARVKADMEACAPTADDLRSLYRWSREYFVRQRRLHRFPGAYLVKAFNLAIKGLHYEIVMNGIVRDASRAHAEPPRAAAPYHVVR